jgi:alkylation response protein AidB-like acyl-CoA dehydrogenase
MHSSSQNGFLGNHFEQATTELGTAQAALDDATDFLRTTRANAPRDADAERASDDPHVILRFGQLQARLHAAQGLLERAKRLADAANRPADPSRATRHAEAPTAALHASSAQSEQLRGATDPAVEIAAIEARAFATDLVAEIVSQVVAWGGPLRARDRPHDINGQRIQNANHWNYHYAGNYYLKGVEPPNTKGNDSGPQDLERQS